MTSVDLILCGRVRTGDPDRPLADAVAIQGGRIVAVGGRPEIEALGGASTERLDQGDAVVIPGFIDAHLHLLALARRRAEVDCSRARTMAEVLEAVRAGAAARPPGAWIRAFGYDESFLAEGRPPRPAELESAAPGRPVRLLHRTGHAAVLNSTARRVLALDDSVAEVLHEPGPLLRGRIPRPAGAELRELVRETSRELLTAGITCLHDPTPEQGPEELEALRSLVDDGAIAQRVRAYGSLEGFRAARDPGERFRCAGVKLVCVEGSSLEEISAAAKAADDAGAQAAIHAVEGGPLAVAAAALAGLGRERVAARRHRIEHASLCPPPLAETIAAAGATVVTHPGFLSEFAAKYVREVPGEHHDWLYPLRRYLDLGIPVALASDAPIGRPSPLAAIAAAAERAPELKGLTQAIGPGAALTLHTAGAARAGGDEHLLGRLAAGFAADAVVLDGDPTLDDPLELSVLATVVAGQVAYRR